MRWDNSPVSYISFLHFSCALIALIAGGLLGYDLSALLCALRPEQIVLYEPWQSVEVSIL
jgi:hypothetical protein